MAELTTQPIACCAPEQQAICCEPEDKRECCGEDGRRCGCSQGEQDLRETVRERYTAAARLAASGQDCGCGSGVSLADRRRAQVFGDALYADEDVGGAGGALAASLA